MAWTVARCLESHIELLELLAGLTPAAHQAVIAHFQKLEHVDNAGRRLGRIVDLPFEWVYPMGDPRRDVYPVVRVQISDDAFGRQELCAFMGFAYKRQVVGVLGNTWWAGATNWLVERVNGIQTNPTFEEYLATRTVSGRKPVHDRYLSFRRKYED